MDLVRRARHISKGGRAFLPEARMRAIRWEEAVGLARARREGCKTPYVERHTTCYCGSIDCVAIPRIRA